MRRCAFVRRATHLLELLGMPIEETAGMELVGGEFLMEVMEVREELEELSQMQFEGAAEAGDSSRRAQLRQENDSRVAALTAELADAFGRPDLEQARMLTARLQYLQRIEDEIHARTDPL